MLQLLDPRDLDELVDEHVTRLRAPADHARRGALPFRARLGRTLIALGTALAGEVAATSVRRPSRPRRPAPSHTA
jgi:hypothetical protein